MSVLNIPIRNSKNRIIGVAQLINKLNGHPFSESDVNVFEVSGCLFELGFRCKLLGALCRKIK